MRYKLFRGSFHINTIEADEAFIKRYCEKYRYTYEPEVLPTPPHTPTQEERIATLEEENAAMQEQLAQADDAAIELYEMQMAQEEINAAQDDALIEIYEMIGG